MKTNFVNIICFIFGASFLMVGAKCSPQWEELIGISRTNYLLLSFSFLIVAIICFIPIIKMLVEKENSK